MNKVVQPDLNLIVTCTKRKRIGADSQIQIRSLKAETQSDRFNEWQSKLKNSTVELTTPRSVYVGDHWSTVRRIADNHPSIQIFVCSAGYGLLTLDNQIKSYSATFSPRQQDSVTKTQGKGKQNESNALWWELLTDWRNPQNIEGLSITRIATTWPTVPILMVASEVYLNAIGLDMKNGQSFLQTSNLLSILSTGTNNKSLFKDNLLATSAKLGQLFGSVTLNSLNVRLAEKLLTTIPVEQIRFETLQEQINAWQNQLQPLPAIRRRKLEDREIDHWIRNQLEQMPEAHSSSKLLRLLRASDRACEQQRFRQLYESVIRDQETRA